MTDTALNKVLHVDDEADIREVAKLALEAVGGLTVESCSSGEDALKKAPEFAPDLVLLDVMMPGFDGPATLQALRSLPEFENTPVIFVTAKAMPSELDRFKELGAAGAIAKPFDPMTLADQLRKIWAEENG